MRSVLLSLVLGLLAVGPVLAVPVNPVAPDGIAAAFVEMHDAYWLATNNFKLWVLCTSGDVYFLTGVISSAQWTLWSSLHPPVPLTDILDWTPICLQTKTGGRWVYLEVAGEDFWRPLPGIPCEPPVPTIPKSLGALKRGYR